MLSVIFFMHLVGTKYGIHRLSCLFSLLSFVLNRGGTNIRFLFWQDCDVGLLILMVMENNYMDWNSEASRLMFGSH